MSATWTSQTWWYVARSSGMVAWALVSASVIWGLLLSGKPVSARRVPWAKPNRLLDLHRFLGAAAVMFTAVHVGALVADSYVDFGLADVLVPFASSWRPAAVAWGVVATWLLLAVELTSLARRRLPKRIWRGIHMASYPLFVMATVHGLTAGTDADHPLFVGAVIVAATAIAGLTVYRVGEVTAARPKPTDWAPPVASARR
jgi:methionine sulfoxide reductase heme-binding subunit